MPPTTAGLVPRFPKLRKPAPPEEEDDVPPLLLVVPPPPPGGGAEELVEPVDVDVVAPSI